MGFINGITMANAATYGQLQLRQAEKARDEAIQRGADKSELMKLQKAITDLQTTIKVRNDQLKKNKSVTEKALIDALQKQEAKDIREYEALLKKKDKKEEERHNQLLKDLDKIRDTTTQNLAGSITKIAGAMLGPFQLLLQPLGKFIGLDQSTISKKLAERMGFGKDSAKEAEEKKRFEYLSKKYSFSNTTDMANQGGLVGAVGASIVNAINKNSSNGSSAIADLLDPNGDGKLALEESTTDKLSDIMNILGTGGPLLKTLGTLMGSAGVGGILAALGVGGALFGLINLIRKNQYVPTTETTAEGYAKRNTALEAGDWKDPYSDLSVDLGEYLTGLTTNSGQLAKSLYNVNNKSTRTAIDSQQQELYDLFNSSFSTTASARELYKLLYAKNDLGKFLVNNTLTYFDANGYAAIDTMSDLQLNTLMPRFIGGLYSAVGADYDNSSLYFLSHGIGAGLAGGASSAFSVDDAIISKNNQLYIPSAEDTIIATKNDVSVSSGDNDFKNELMGILSQMLDKLSNPNVVITGGSGIDFGALRT